MRVCYDVIPHFANYDYFQPIVVAAYTPYDLATIRLPCDVFGQSAVSGYSLLTGCPTRPALLARDASELRYSFACLPLTDVFGWPASRIVQLRFMVAQSTNCPPACYFAAHRATRYKHSELSRHQPFSYHKYSAVILMSFAKLILA